MHQIAATLESIIEKSIGPLKQIPETEFAKKNLPGKWSKKEILGHLLDSAQNNIRRFIVATYEIDPHIVYKQDDWVAASDYQHWPVGDLIELWRLLNKQIVFILQNTSPSSADRNVLTQELHSVKWLAEDYVKHLLHHLHVVLDLEPVAYP